MKLTLRFRRLCKSESGASLLELALVIPVLLLISMFAVDFGMEWYVGMEVINAAHAAAEYAAQHPADTAGMTDAAQQSAPNLTNLVVSAPTYGCECGNGTSYSASCASPPACASGTVNKVQVTTSATYHSLVHWGSDTKGSFTPTYTATMRGLH
jgi:Flp pilus assembly protein TadG